MRGDFSGTKQQPNLSELIWTIMAKKTRSQQINIFKTTFLLAGNVYTSPSQKISLWKYS